MRVGQYNRVTDATKQNTESSRSHAIFIATLIQKQSSRESIFQLYLVDLAGSEKQKKSMATGLRLRESQAINRSLLALGNVIFALSQKHKHIPYRDSKLTRILQNSFGGNSKTVLIICCSPIAFNAKETLATLRFGKRTEHIENKPIMLNVKKNS